jgi:hypothetical protein
MRIKLIVFLSDSFIMARKFIVLTMIFFRRFSIVVLVFWHLSQFLLKFLSEVVVWVIDDVIEWGRRGVSGVGG